MSMSISIDLDKVANLVKVIRDKIRCPVCDRIEGCRYRFSCGHVICSECFLSVSSCLICLTPPSGESAAYPKLDKVFTQYVKHAVELLNAFQTTFNTDVDKRQRLSEQLKKEKELFPECIQAPQTYYNKNKSYSKSIRGKENRKTTIFPGELIDSAINMENSKSYVQDWLDQHETELFQFQPRRPFSDLGVNSPRYQSTPIKRRADHIIDKVKQKITKTKHKKISLNKSATSAKSVLGQYQKLTVNIDKNNDQLRRPLVTSINENDESGIVADETIVIEDSQPELADKDRLALLAVLEAENINSITEPSRVTDLINNHTPDLPAQTCTKDTQLEIKLPIKSKALNPCNWLSSDDENDNKRVKRKVPFYRKSILDPNSDSNVIENNKTEAKNTDVSISIETSTLIATVSVSRCTPNKPTHKVSKYVQTDLIGEDKMDIETKMNDLDESIITVNQESQDLFTVEAKQEPEQRSGKIVQIIESSDSENEPSSLTLSVTAEVHKSREEVNERAILKEIPVTSAHKKKPKKRGKSTESSNSSNKENRDPYKRKKRKIQKKNCKKKQPFVFNL